MDHAEVLARIEDAVAAPGGLARFGVDPSPAAVAVRAHIAGCGPCAAEWRAWSVVSLGLASAAPDTLAPRPELRDEVLAAVAARPRTAPPMASQASDTPAPPPVAGGIPMPSAAEPVAADAGPAVGSTRSGIALGPRRARTTVPSPAARQASGPPFRWLLVAAAVAVVLFLMGALLGGQLLRTPTAPTGTPITADASPSTTRGDPGRVLAETAIILQTAGYRLAPLETAEGDAGGVVVVSPVGRLAVVSSVLAEPADGVRYVCLLDRGGAQTKVGYMRWEPTADGGGLAYWAGDAEPSDLGAAGDVFIVQLDTPDAQPALTGIFGD
ncbi:MAG: hypothetical protein U0667_02060 [Chloroflexota bacterium]